ncbi:MAG: GWxTD domain-containing protein [Balneolaceae bacterium]
MGYLFTILLLLIQLTINQTQSVNHYIEKGLELEKQGKPIEALKLWQQATMELDVPSLALATEFLRLATEHGLSDYYRTASALYQWGLSGTDEIAMLENRQELQQELQRLEPLVKKKESRRWKNLLENNDPQLFEEIRLFWERLDLILSTLNNERLIEHWERIAYSRKHFTKKSDPPYGTDDRGTVYVQYGEPDKIYNDNLNITSGEAETITQNVSILENTSDLSGFSAGGVELENALASLEEILELDSSTMVLSNAVFELDVNPEFVIWIYNKPDERMRNNLIFIFGNKNLGPYQRLDTIEDLIPSRAFTFSSRYEFPDLRRQAAGLLQIPSRLNPGMVMQYLYYRSLMHVDPFFADQFHDLNLQLFQADAANVGRYIGDQQRHKTTHIIRQNINLAPSEMSTYEKLFPSIPVETWHYRFLNEENRPITATFLESRPGQVFLDDLAINQDVLFPDDSLDFGHEQAFVHYNFIHGVQVHDSDGRLLTRIHEPLELIIDLTDDSPNTSVFTVPYVNERQQLLLYAELHNHHPDSQPSIDSPFPASLRGLGKLEDSLPEPLSVEPGRLEMSDLVLGYQKQEDSTENVLFDFVVSNHREIPEGENLVVHFEVYQLQTDNRGIARFEVEYEIRPRGGLFGWLKRSLDEFNITLNFEHQNDRFAESLEIEADGLGTGKYELSMKIVDLQNSQSIERKIDFEVINLFN